MRESFQKAGHFVAQAFCDNGTPSSSRLLTIPHSVAAIFVLIYATIKNHAVPDATICAGLGTFATIHYLVNKTGSAVQSFSPNKQNQDQNGQ